MSAVKRALHNNIESTSVVISLVFSVLSVFCMHPHFVVMAATMPNSSEIMPNNEIENRAISVSHATGININDHKFRFVLVAWESS